MAQPSIATVSIGSNRFNAIGIHFGLGTLRDGMAGMPVMGSMACSIAVVVNLNDQVNLPFAVLNEIFQLSHHVTRDKIQDIVLTFWTDDSKQDVICTYTFRGWITNYVTATGVSRGSSEGGDATNHLLTLTLEPELDKQHFIKVQLGNRPVAASRRFTNEALGMNA